MHDRRQLLEFIWPYCRHDRVAVLYPKGKHGLSPGWISGPSAERAVSAYRDGTLSKLTFQSKTKAGKPYTIRRADRLGVVLHRDGFVTVFCVDLDDHTGDGGNVRMLAAVNRFFGPEPIVFTSKGGKGLHLFLILTEPIPVKQFVDWSKAWGFNREGQPELFPKSIKDTQAWLPNDPNEQGGDAYRSGDSASCMIAQLHAPPRVRLTTATLAFLRGSVFQPGRNQALNKAAFELAQRRVEESEAWRLCLLGAQLCGLQDAEPTETRATFESGYHSGKTSIDSCPKRGKRATAPSNVRIIRIDATSDPVGQVMGEITDRLIHVGGCYSRADQLIIIHGENVQCILTPAQLAGVLNEHVEFLLLEGRVGQFRPLPTSYANTWLNHPAQRRRLPQVGLFTRNPVYTFDWRLIEPGYDKRSKIYYAGPRIEVRSGTDTIDRLLQDFCFRQCADRTNYLGMLLTTILVPHFVGAKPGALFNGNQPELGKSILAQIIAILRDGAPVETATYNPNDEEFEKRLGSMVRRGATTIIIDNAKGHGRSPRIESACLERSITDPILSFRLLGFSQDIRAENSHIFCITANSADVGRDLITRTVPINLYYEGTPTRRRFSIASPEDFAIEHRNEILGELVGMVERWRSASMPHVDVDSRFNKRGWGNIVGGILEVSSEPDFLVNAAESARELDDTYREFAELVTIMMAVPMKAWTGAELAQRAKQHQLLGSELGDGSPRSQATRMGVLASRFVGERFTLAGGQQVVFQRSGDRKGSIYHAISNNEVPNVKGVAERLPDVESGKRSAP